MITTPTEEADLQAKQEEKKDEGVVSWAVPSSSRQWSSFRNPRIVRVSRSFEGKDRHSKVCTVKGLRDRRIRLSVPTAIQLYDLQDKLGLSQPSKVIDWLLDATKHDIDKLPPLQMPQGFSQLHSQMFSDSTIGPRKLGDLMLPHEPITSEFSLSPFFPMSTSKFLSNRGIKINDSVNEDGPGAAGASSSKYWDIDLGLRAKDKELLQLEPLDDEKGKSVKMNELQKHVGIGGHFAQLSAPNFFPLVSYSSFPTGSTGNAMPHSYNQWEPSNLSLSQFGGLQPQMENFLHSNSASLPLSSSPSALPPGSQLCLCPPMLPSLPTYPPYLAVSTENDLRQINHFQLLSSSSSQPILHTSFMPPLHPPYKPFQTNTYAKFLHPQDDSQSQDDEQAN